MITSEAGFLIATPTKCGTTTMEAIAKRHMRTAGADGDLFRIMDWDSPRRQHRMALPPEVDSDTFFGMRDHGGGEHEWGEVQRYLFVRNPYTRYMSVYTYLSAPANYSQWGAREIQGNEWGGHDKSKMLKRPKMDFETFLYWLADQRAKKPKNRGELTEGRAYRSPWVWTDSLSFSLDALRSQPGAAQEQDVEFLRLENVWSDLRALSGDWQLGLDLDRPIHANRSTGYGESGADPSSKEFWGGIRCARKAFRGRVFDSNWVADMNREGEGCGCAACAVGVFGEAVAVGYCPV